MSAANKVAFGLFVALSGTAAFFYSRISRKLAAWSRAQGTVIEIHREQLWDQDDGYRWMCAPRIRFKAKDGSEITFQDAIWSSGPQHRIGEKVNVYYDPHDPGSATLAGWRPYFGTLICTSAALMALVMSLMD